MIKVCCIIPSLTKEDQSSFLLKCIKSLLDSSRRKVSLQIVVVTENPRPKTRSSYLKKIRFITVDKGLGFSQKINVGVQKTEKEFNPEYFMVINDDAYVKSDFFDKFLESLKKKSFDIVVPLVYKTTKGIDSFGAEYFTSGFARNVDNLKTFTNIAPANCVFYKSSFIKNLKKRFGYVFNPILEFYFEDVELSLRAHGVRASFEFNPNLIAHHYGSLSSGKHSYFRTFYSYRNVIWLIIINWPIRLITKYLINIILVQIYAMFKSLINFGPSLYLKVILSTIINIRLLFIYRKKTQRGYLRNFDFEKVLKKKMYRVQSGRYI